MRIKEYAKTIILTPLLLIPTPLLLIPTPPFLIRLSPVHTLHNFPFLSKT
jgi:hypothetical protein